MIFKNIDFYNVDELRKEEDGSYAILRIPFEVESQLDAKDMRYIRCSSSTELRFIMKSEQVKIRLKSIFPEIQMVKIYVGDIPICPNYYITKNSDPIVINKADLDPMNCRDYTNKQFESMFDPNVIRIVLGYGQINFVDIEGEVTTPTPDMYPSKKILAYGSSITAGVGASTVTQGYTRRIATALNSDIKILGYPGCCRLEKAMADYIAKQDFDFAILELGINIIGYENCDMFRERLKYLLPTVSNAHKDKKLFLISPFLVVWDDMGEGKPAQIFRDIFKEVVEELKIENAVYIDGLSLQNSPQYLCVDAIHPDDQGHEIIADKVIEIIKTSL